MNIYEKIKQDNPGWKDETIHTLVGNLVQYPLKDSDRDLYELHVFEKSGAFKELTEFAIAFQETAKAVFGRYAGADTTKDMQVPGRVGSMDGVYASVSAFQRPDETWGYNVTITAVRNERTYKRTMSPFPDGADDPWEEVTNDK